MKRSALFILIFTSLVISVFYFLSKKNNQSQMATNITQTTTNSTQTSPSPTAASQTLTMAQVSKHNTKSDCYLVVKNKVYDVSSYISQHPGGQGRIVSVCGQEVTGAFASIHSNYAWDLLKNYQIGQI